MKTNQIRGDLHFHGHHGKEQKGIYWVEPLTDGFLALNPHVVVRSEEKEREKISKTEKRMLFILEMNLPSPAAESVIKSSESYRSSTTYFRSKEVEGQREGEQTESAPCIVLVRRNQRQLCPLLL